MFDARYPGNPFISAAMSSFINYLYL